MADRRNPNVSDTFARYPDRRQGERRTGDDRRDGKEHAVIGGHFFRVGYSHATHTDRRQSTRRKGENDG